ncbi:uncharacterized protein [Procambarus clarkii]|uniref:uncharacterized protein n=1 Tax=Procambarus clarkii TaxID=6728 RepID=UPI001E676F3B|nr:uncharacterized protein LOC123755392 [Procambarus clarkii]
MAHSDSSDEDSVEAPSQNKELTQADEAEPKLKGTERILSKVTNKPDDYSFLEEPGAAKVQNLDSNTELYIFAIPSKTLDPLNLVNAHIVIGGTKEQNLIVQKQQYRIVTCENSSADDTSTLFLPDEKGELHAVNSMVKGRVMIRGQLGDLDNHSRINIDDLRCVQHKPPTDIKERNFWSSIDNAVESEVIKNTVDKGVDETLTHSAKKKKKKKRRESMDLNDGSQAKEALDIDSSLNTSTTHKKKVKKSKRQKEVNTDSSAENLVISDDMFEDSPKKKKKVKSFNVTV